MNLPLFSAMQTKILNDLDLNEETFIQPSEMQDYFNEAIDMIEAEVHTIYEDYFKRMIKYSPTAGQSTLQLPADIFAQKIRKFYLNIDVTKRYEITRVRNQDEVLDIDVTDRYKYDLLNDGPSEENVQGITLQLYPAIRSEDAGTETLQMFYIRNASRYVDKTSICDIPEFSNVINQYVRYKCRAKEGHPDAQSDLADLQSIKGLMLETLRDRVIDENTEIRKDFSFYTDFDSLPYYY
jgi:hypothetical protein